MKCISLDSANTKCRDQTKGLPETCFEYSTQMRLLRCLYLEHNTDYSNLIKQELERKIASYRNQDKIKKKICTLISLDELIEKLLISSLTCLYCKQQVQILYKNTREPLQWTLDRKDNANGHSNNNTVICCLKCNLKRRTTNMDKFLFTKQLKIIKK